MPLSYVAKQILRERERGREGETEVGGKERKREGGRRKRPRQKERERALRELSRERERRSRGWRYSSGRRGGRLDPDWEQQQQQLSEPVNV